jgi:hypothetical protein
MPFARPTQNPILSSPRLPTASPCSHAALSLGASASPFALNRTADSASTPCAASLRALSHTTTWFQHIPPSPAAHALCTAAALLHSPVSRTTAPVLITSIWASCTPSWHKEHSSGRSDLPLQRRPPILSS